MSNIYRPCHNSYQDYKRSNTKTHCRWIRWSTATYHNHLKGFVHRCNISDKSSYCIDIPGKHIEFYHCIIHMWKIQTLKLKTIIRRGRLYCHLSQQCEEHVKILVTYIADSIHNLPCIETFDATKPCFFIQSLYSIPKIHCIPFGLFILYKYPRFRIIHYSIHIPRSRPQQQHI